MIPKVIHYCWFGGKPLPRSVKECIKTWQEKCPDYQIIEWNEKNFDVNSHPFMKTAYETKAWAFVSDYARLKVIYENGGFYLDTDVELLKSLDELCENKCYFGIEQNNCIVATGLGFGAEKGNKTIQDMMKEYDITKFLNGERKKFACPILNTRVLERKGFVKENKLQNLGDVVIYPAEYFDPIAPANTVNLMSENTISIHHYSATWTSKSNRLKRVIINSIGQERISKFKELIKR
ncbi:MAG: exopolysaccharide biosynthesis protein [Clostridia bacterium]|nr:exopolysaccharide biosynthesis protein [Clostridia bacterium]